MSTIGMIGTGHVGAQIARAVAVAGYDVVLSNAGGVGTLGGLVSELAPRATAATVPEAAARADLVVVAVPMRAFSALPADALAGKVVAVTSNYNRDREGPVLAIDEQRTTVPGILQAVLPRSRVVRAFSHISSAELTTDGSPAGTPHRRALAFAGDDSSAGAAVAALYDAIGFDALDLGGLDEAWRIDRGQPAFIAHLDLEQLQVAVARADRRRSGR
ncbi:NADPH-dependent F420 reductase [Amnibacterium endophyticum]|uniref:NADPH-dependent F420 reductase n=1 Tax=Amnibacterium endophyticum TaxID=2109337 RepID=A0ABW4LGI2_9MICO